MVAHLTLSQPDPTGYAHVSAASSLAAAGGASWVVSDRYGELVRFGDLREHGTLLPGLANTDLRPDLESLVAIPVDGSDDRLLVAFGSGSTTGRDRALTQLVDAVGVPIGGPVESSLAELYAELDRRLPLQPNIEALAVRGAWPDMELLVFHRGKLAEDANTILCLDATRVVNALLAGEPVPGNAVRSESSFELGSLGGYRLGFADARVLVDGRIAFAASAEGADAVDDGTITGSAVGILDADFNVQVLRPLTGPARKVEGLELSRDLDPTASTTSFTLVTDPDDPAKASEVLVVDLASAPT